MAEQSIAIFDLDNCLSNDAWRLKLIPWKSDPAPSDFDAYHKNMGVDGAINSGFFWRQKLVENRSLLFITSRPTKYRAETVGWLRRCLISDEDDWRLLMRPDGCLASSAELKVDLFNCHIRSAAWTRVEAAFDDREDVLEAYREQGVKNTYILNGVQNRQEFWSAEECYPVGPDLNRIVGSPTPAKMPPIDSLSGEETESFSVEQIKGFDQQAIDDFVVSNNSRVGGLFVNRSRISGDEPLSSKHYNPRPRPEEFGERSASLNDPQSVLREAAQTFEERNAIYGNNYRQVGPIMNVLFPEGVSAELIGSDQFHLFELLVVKLSRLANAGLQHIDSARDLAVYAAMIESIIHEQEKGNASTK